MDPLRTNNYKYVDIHVDFPRQKNSKIHRLFSKMESQDFYIGNHIDEFYPDGLRIDGLRKPWIDPMWLHQLLETMGIHHTKLEFKYYHFWDDNWDEKTHELTVTYLSDGTYEHDLTITNHEETPC